MSRLRSRRCAATCRRRVSRPPSLWTTPLRCVLAGSARGWTWSPGPYLGSLRRRELRPTPSVVRLLPGAAARSLTQMARQCLLVDDARPWPPVGGSLLAARGLGGRGHRPFRLVGESLCESRAVLRQVSVAHHTQSSTSWRSRLRNRLGADQCCRNAHRLARRVDAIPSHPTLGVPPCSTVTRHAVRQSDRHRRQRSDASSADAAGRVGQDQGEQDRFGQP